MPEIDVHPLIAHISLEREVEASLRANELNPKLLYVTPRQTELWRQVFLKHSPIHGNPEFARIYRDAFTRLAEEWSPGKIWLVGLGCGTGMKERELCSQLESNGHEVTFSAIDVSRDLAAESAQRLADAGARSERHYVCDLYWISSIQRWLDEINAADRRIITLFGLVPNLPPPFVVRLLSDLLRPGDVLLINAHLAPVGDGVDLEEAMQKVLPQYANPETLAWLGAALDQWKLRESMGEPRMDTGLMKTIPAILAFTDRKSPATADFLLFRSLRYTPELFENLLSDAGFETERLAMTACREEAIWSVRQRMFAHE
jgi:L-histidine N-alpha-methyltransferase